MELQNVSQPTANLYNALMILLNENYDNPEEMLFSFDAVKRAIPYGISVEIRALCLESMAIFFSMQPYIDYSFAISDDILYQLMEEGEEPFFYQACLKILEKLDIDYFNNIFYIEHISLGVFYIINNIIKILEPNNLLMYQASLTEGIQMFIDEHLNEEVVQKAIISLNLLNQKIAL